MPRRTLPTLALTLLALALPAAAPAAVTASGPGGFALHFELDSPHAPPVVWQRLVRPAEWWSATHTYSGDARALWLDPVPGGLWGERLADGGFVRHMEIVYVQPGRALRLAGGLGPLQRLGVSGALGFTLQPGHAGGTRLLVDYVVGGFAPGGLDALAAPVDAVLGEQLVRLSAP